MSGRGERAMSRLTQENGVEQPSRIGSLPLDQFHCPPRLGYYLTPRFQPGIGRIYWRDGYSVSLPERAQIERQSVSSGKTWNLPFLWGQIPDSHGKHASAGTGLADRRLPAGNAAPTMPEGDVKSAFEENLEAHLQQADVQQIPPDAQPTPAAWEAPPSNSDDREQELAIPGGRFRRKQPSQRTLPTPSPCRTVWRTPLHRRSNPPQFPLRSRNLPCPTL